MQAAQVSRQVAGISSADLAGRGGAACRALSAGVRESSAEAVGAARALRWKAGTDRQCWACSIGVCWRGRKLEIVYRTARRQGNVSERVVHPYHIMPHVRSWQLIAYCEKRQDVIMFKVDRIQKATLLDESYEIAGGFDLDAYMGDAWGRDAARGSAAGVGGAAFCAGRGPLGG